MTAPSFFYHAPGPSENDTLLVAVFLATVMHVVIILGISFSTPKPEEVNHAIEITLANTPVNKAPEKADFLAQANQIGAGEKKTKPAPPKQQLPSHGETPKKQPQNKPVKKQISAPKKVITTTAPSKQKTIETPKNSEAKQKQPQQLSVASLHQQITQLGTEIRQHQQSADLSKIKHLNSVSTHKYLAAQYMKDWETKVERIGNLNYPEVAKKKNFHGTLTMEVGIKADGSIYNMRIKRSSGNKALDDAAIRIVRISAPFPPLPDSLLKELDVLIITRVWKFSDESGMTTR